MPLQTNAKPAQSNLLCQREPFASRPISAVELQVAVGPVGIGVDEVWHAELAEPDFDPALGRGGKSENAEQLLSLDWPRGMIWCHIGRATYGACPMLEFRTTSTLVKPASPNASPKPWPPGFLNVAEQLGCAGKAQASEQRKDARRRTLCLGR